MTAEVRGRVALEALPVYHAGEAAKGGGRGVKLSANEQATPPPRFVRRALRRGSREVHRYPPARPDSVLRLLAARLDTPVETLTLGNGSDELMGLVGQAYLERDDEVIIARHTFSVYRHVALVAGAVPVVAEMRNGVGDIDSVLGRVSARTKLIFIATPNNPTGGYLTVAEMRRVCAEAPPQALVVIDHAYGEFCRAGDFGIAEGMLAEFPRLIVLRTCSKLYGVAGLRLGYAVAHPRVAERLNRVRMPFNINRCALAAAEAILSRPAYFLRRRDRIVAERELLRGHLRSVGYDALPTHGNFICLRLSVDGAGLVGWLRAHGVAVRPLHSFGLPRHVRITVTAKRRINARVLALLTRYARGGAGSPSAGSGNRSERAGSGNGASERAGKPAGAAEAAE